MYALRDEDGKIVGDTPVPNHQKGEKVDEKSQEWLDYLKPTKAQQIAELEGMVTERWKRTALLGDEYAINMIRDIEAKINDLRTK